MSGADVTAPGGPRARRFPAAQPLRAIFCRAVVAVAEEDLKTVSSRLRCDDFYFGVNWDFGFYLSASGECLKIKVLVLGRLSTAVF